MEKAARVMDWQIFEDGRGPSERAAKTRRKTYCFS